MEDSLFVSRARPNRSRLVGQSEQRQRSGTLYPVGARSIGGGVDTAKAPVTPFNVFLNTRGGQFTTPEIGLSQAPPSGGPQGGLAVLFNNPTYASTFSTFSPCGCSLQSAAI